MMKPDFTFVIDTNSYAGSFERQMCGFMTGDGGEYGYKDVDNIFRAEVGDGHPLGDIIEYRVDDSDDVPVHAPVRIWSNPRWFNNGVGGHFRRDDPKAEAKALVAHRKFVIRQAEKQIKLVRSHVNLDAATRERIGWSDEAIERAVVREQKKIEEAKVATSTSQYPAYNSVGIFMGERPTDEQIVFLKDRARRFIDFCQQDEKHYLPKDLQIEGFRLIEEVTTKTAIDL